MTKKPKAKDTKFSKDNQPEQRGDLKANGNGNAKRHIMTDALMTALNREVESIVDGDKKKTRRLTNIAETLARKAEAGDTQAIKEIFDRTEGKAAQAIIHQGDADNPLEFKMSDAQLAARIATLMQKDE